MKTKVVLLVGVVLAGAVGVVLVTQSSTGDSLESAQEILQERRLPLLPVDAGEVRVDCSGFFAKWCFIRARVPAASMEDFAARVSNMVGQGLRIGGSEAEVFIGRPVDLQGQLGQSDARLVSVEVASDTDAASWWTPNEITAGLFFEGALPDAERVRVYLDTDRHLIFVYWSYS